MTHDALEQAYDDHDTSWFLFCDVVSTLWDETSLQMSGGYRDVMCNHSVFLCFVNDTSL